MTWELERLLRSEAAGDMLSSALASGGLNLESWRLHRVYSRPLKDGVTSEVSARFQVMAQGRELTLVASSRELQPDQRQALGAVRADSAAGRLHIWVHPADPQLPGLQVVEDPVALARHLEPVLGAQVQVRAVEMLVLRPLRRAVYRVQVDSRQFNPELGGHILFVKVVRPGKAALLLRRWAACSLAPRAADAGQGLIVTEAAAGRSLTELLHRPSSPQPGMRISPQAVLSALDSLEAEAVQLPPREPPAARHRSFLEPLVAAGAQRPRLQRLTRSITAELLAAPGPVVPTHGDFHPANLFLTPDGTRPAALIDADTVGPGYRADDVAMFFAHLLALPSFDAAGYADVPVLIRQLWEAVRYDGDAADLPARIAACLLSLAPGARSGSQLEHYISTAEALVNRDQSHRVSSKFTAP